MFVAFAVNNMNNSLKILDHSNLQTAKKGVEIWLDKNLAVHHIKKVFIVDTDNFTVAAHMTLPEQSYPWEGILTYSDVFSLVEGRKS